MKFEYIDLLWVAVAVSFLTAVFLIYNWRVKRRLMRVFVKNRDLEIGVAPWLQKLRLFMVFLGLSLAMVSLSRPQWGRSEQEFVEKGIDVIIAIDTSKSLLAQDLPPSRFERIRLAVMDLLERNNGNRYGLVVFAGSAFLQTPLTSDPGALRQTLDALYVGMIPDPGSNFSEALQECAKAFDKDDNRYKAVILFSDGEDHSSETEATAQALASQKIRIFTVGAATDEGELIPVTDENNRQDFHRDSEGNVVKTRLNSERLTTMALAAQGFYVNLRDINAIDRIMEDGIDTLPKSDLSVKKFSQLNEQFHWPLSIAVILLVLEFMLPEHRLKKRRISALPRLPLWVAGFLYCMVGFSGMHGGHLEASNVNKAEEAYNSGSYDVAKSYYNEMYEKQPLDPRIAYNLGSTEYQLKNYDRASELFKQILNTENLDLQQKAYYGLGNSRFLQGNQVETPEEKLKVWKESLEMLEAAAALNPEDNKAVTNRDYVKRAIDQLQQQQEQDQEQNQDEEQEQDQDQNQENQQDQDQNQQDQENNEDQNGDKQENKDQGDQQEQEGGDQDQQNNDQQQQQEDGEDQKKDPDQQQQGNNNNQDRQQQKEQEEREDDRSREQRDAEEGKPESQPPPQQQGQAQQKSADISEQQMQNFLKSLDQQSRFLLLPPTNRATRRPGSSYKKDW